MNTSMQKQETGALLRMHENGPSSYKFSFVASGRRAKRGGRGGYLVIFILIFGSVFFMIIAGFAGYLLTDRRSVEASYQKERALEIAEAGLNYYKWYLAHFADDITNGTGEPGPYVHSFADPESGDIGTFSLQIASSTACGEVYAIDVTATGRTDAAPEFERTIFGRYSRPTIAEYAYIINANVWAGSDRTIIGPYYANGAIRMDGTNQSTVTSGLGSWVCNEDELSCDPHNHGDTIDPVFGDGSGSDLWVFPETPINFDGITFELAQMKGYATSSGVYIPPSGDYGYHLVLGTGGTVDIYRVTDTDDYWAYSRQDEWHIERGVIADETFVGTYTIPEACGLVFVEDDVWLEGTLDSKVTIAAADTADVNPSIVLHNNITYADNNAGLLAVAEKDVLVGLVVPDTMELSGIFVAQGGRFGRNYYHDAYLSSSLDPYIMRDTLTINGTIVSRGRVGTKWTSGGEFSSGFETRINTYDRNLVADPPPLTPESSDTYRFVEWREVE